MQSTVKNAEAQLVADLAVRAWEVLSPRLHVAEAGPFGLEGAKEKVLRLLRAEGGLGAVLVAGPGAAVV